jgi:peptidoglycan/LPS O-acetylase OafA/YrhL
MIEHLFGDLLRQTPPAVGPMSALANTVVQNVSLGRFGVALFFLISGFAVPFSIGGERPPAHFFISRVFRLYPACWLALAVLATWHGLRQSHRAWRLCWPR